MIGRREGDVATTIRSQELRDKRGLGISGGTAALDPGRREGQVDLPVVDNDHATRILIGFRTDETEDRFVASERLS
jgi:hypothetical protein